MAKRQGRTNQTTAHQETSPIIPANTLGTIPNSAPIAKRHIWDVVKVFAEKGVDNAIDNIWGLIWAIVGGVIVTFATTLGFYLWSGEAEWLYPFIKYFLAFFSGMLLIVFFIFCLTLFRIRKEKKLEKSRDEKFISNEKGLFDYQVDYEKAQYEFPLVLVELGKSVNRIAGTIAEVDFESWDQVNAGKRLKLASGLATKLLTHSKGMALQATKLVNVISALDISVSSLLRLNAFNKNKFDNIKLSLNDLLNGTQTSVESMILFKESQVNALGVSKDLNTSLNHLIYVTDGIIETLKNAKTTWIKIIQVIDEIKKQTV